MTSTPIIFTAEQESTPETWQLAEKSQWLAHVSLLENHNGLHMSAHWKITMACTCCRGTCCREIIKCDYLHSSSSWEGLKHWHELTLSKGSTVELKYTAA